MDIIALEELSKSIEFVMWSEAILGIIEIVVYVLLTIMYVKTRLND